MLKLTSKPVHDQLVDSHFLTHGVRDFEKRHCGFNCAAIGVQNLTLMYLLLCMDHLDEAIRSVLGVGVLGVELLDGLLEIRSVAV